MTTDPLTTALDHLADLAGTTPGHLAAVAEGTAPADSPLTTALAAGWGSADLTVRTLGEDA